ncbi:unnamed protein product [Dicrocoelium dendriticum]|nr:unnamed protein product [Dicrocoelium dendriticum]
MFSEPTEVAEPTPPPPIPPSSLDRPVDIKGNLDLVEQTFEEELALKHEIEDLGYFFPECWYAEDGRPKPRYFCGFLQGLISRLTDSSGVTLSHFAMEHQWLFGPQAVRRLVFFLRDMGAVRLCRVVRHTKPGLFSARPTYTVSDEPILASPEELTLIPTPHCLSIVGAFCEQFLARTETSTKTPHNATTSATSDVQDNQTD